MIVSHSKSNCVVTHSGRFVSGSIHPSCRSQPKVERNTGECLEAEAGAKKSFQQFQMSFCKAWHSVPVATQDTNKSSREFMSLNCIQVNLHQKWAHIPQPEANLGLVQHRHPAGSTMSLCLTQIRSTTVFNAALRHLSKFLPLCASICGT